MQTYPTINAVEDKLTKYTTLSRFIHVEECLDNFMLERDHEKYVKEATLKFENI